MEYLRQITEDNFMEAFNLKLANGQERFVSHPIRSLAQAYVYRNQCQPFGIYKDDTMIGYVMVIYDYDIPEYDIWHMMIDESNQGQGYGSIALDLVIEYIKTKPFGASDKVTLTCNIDNIHALNLYKNKGFKETGTMDEDAMFAETAGSVPLLLCVVLCGFASMNFMTAPSISLEGISLWLLQSLPIDTWKTDDSRLT
ncbi:MAG: GNAT family N-acetyltransferase [Agathobacter sp.]|uniref:GNAT family N-acetyltransferase n=1 Tax=Agathobacter sp. TaxID=2021311 RepID=UPI002E770479|nr:GNAT family N-acetyltransferase [Agathobacter sp.]MEE1216169.1 GNAT family N-acetyltransferase [Agathobacter sp.]MEE1248928.1 GNAT family N-acetyltransferase [Lachnospiraceae bacterium]